MNKPAAWMATILVGGFGTIIGSIFLFGELIYFVKEAYGQGPATFTAIVVLLSLCWIVSYFMVCGDRGDE